MRVWWHQKCGLPCFCPHHFWCVKPATLQRFVSTTRNCSIKRPPVQYVSAVVAAGLGGSEVLQNYLRVVMVNKFPFSGDIGKAGRNSVLVFLHPPPGIKPLQYLLKPQLALLCLHVHQRGTTQVHSVIRCTPEQFVVPHPAMHACIIKVGKHIMLLLQMKFFHWGLCHWNSCTW